MSYSQDGADLIDDEFVEEDYLRANNDVDLAVKAGHFASGRQHYDLYGRNENRMLRISVLRTREELDEYIATLQELEKKSFSEWLRARQTSRFFENTDALPTDPLSAEYKTQQMELYKELSGASDYNPWAAEPIKITPEISADPRPFPFSSGDGELIAGHLSALAQILRILWKVSPGTDKSVLEYGCGTGFTTVSLAASGYAMTAVDINADALAVVDLMAQQRRLPITTFNGVFGSSPKGSEKFDFILFYEAFHHCLDFSNVLLMLHSRLKPGGAIIFAGEPIYHDFPKAWGLRLDGASLYEIRTKGWLELGFNYDFFVSVLRDTGWTCEKHSFPDLPDIFVARSSS